VAKWEGDTLVVDRIAFDERMWLDGASHPHSDRLNIIEESNLSSLRRLALSPASALRVNGHEPLFDELDVPPILPRMVH
jgi:hypothetical protein